MKYFLVILLLLSSPAFAEKAPVAPPVLDTSLCQAMATYQPSDDVAYVPGVDVNGKPVVEADLSSSPVILPDVTGFDITVDVARYAGLATAPADEMLAAVGRVEIGKNGHMTFNGQPMEGEAEAALRALCVEKPPLQKD